MDSNFHMSVKRAIIGVGNKLMGDEGIGIHAIEHLRQKKGTGYFSAEKSSLSPFDVLDGGTGGMTLLHSFEEYDEVIIIDCADIGGKPGEVRSFALDQVNLAQDTSQVSLHSTSLAGILAFAEKLGKKMPKMTIIAVQPAKIWPSLELSNECRLALPLIEEEIKRLA